MDLVGERRLRAAIPLLIDRLRIDTDYLRECVTEAIAKIGDPEAVHLIRTIFPTEPLHVKNHASGAMGKIRHPAAEEAILDCWRSRKIPASARCSAWNCARCFLSGEWKSSGVRYVPATIGRSFAWRTIFCPSPMFWGSRCRRPTLWRAEREEKERRKAERRAELDEMGRRYQALKARGIDPFAKLAEKPKSPSRAQPLPEALEPVRLDRPKVGRNDPCPCGSGKKFKKRCARKSD